MHPPVARGSRTKMDASPKKTRFGGTDLIL
jgi:hypothetical protein